MSTLRKMNDLHHDRLYQLIESIQERAQFDHPVSAFKVIETHISYILLTGRYAYKFKKPVNLGFLDFSTLEKRKFYCEEEIRLNSRLAPGIYMGVVTITGDEHHPKFGGEGDVLEYAVKMVQFSKVDELERVLRDGRLEPRHVDSLAESIAAFHLAIASAGPDTPYGSTELNRRYTMENFTHIRPALKNERTYRDRLDNLEQWTVTELERLDRIFRNRKQQGMVRECHGDLHVGNIAIHDGAPVIFDCIEFNPELHWIDTMSEAAFLIMDLDARGRSEFGRRFLNRYLELTGDYPGLAVLRFYLVYRALVRCKIACIRLGQADLSRPGGVLELEHEHKYLDLAGAYTCPARPVLIITHGLSGSGKTTVTQDLLEQLGAVRLRSDIERKRLPGTVSAVTGKTVPGQGIYDESHTVQTYQYLAGTAKEVLEAGYPVIVDATFLRSRQREMFRSIAAAGGYRFSILDFHATEDQLRDRIMERLISNKDASEADLEVLDYQLSFHEPLSKAEQADTVFVDTSVVTDADEIIRQINQKMDQTPFISPSGETDGGVKTTG